MTQPFIVTASGMLFPLLKPEPQHVRLRDISRHLAKINRFNGATRECYSVAQHSLHVCQLLALRKASPLLQLHGLLHDAHEAYSGDITRPMKLALKAHGALCNLDDIEGEISCAIFQAFDVDELPANDFPKIAHADFDMLATEFRDLMPESGFAPNGTPTSFHIKPMRWDVAEEKFLKKFHELVAITGVQPMTGALE
jgi:uncharacterized protein